MLAKRQHDEIRDQVEEGKLQHGDNHRERHRAEVTGRELELFGERVHLAVNKGAPALYLGSGDANACKDGKAPMGHAYNRLGHKGDGEDHEQDHDVPAKAEEAQDG